MRNSCAVDPGYMGAVYTIRRRCGCCLEICSSGKIVRSGRYLVLGETWGRHFRPWEETQYCVLRRKERSGSVSSRFGVGEIGQFCGKEIFQFKTLTICSGGWLRALTIVLLCLRNGFTKIAGMLAIEGVADTCYHTSFRAVVYDHFAPGEHLHDAVVAAA